MTSRLASRRAAVFLIFIPILADGGPRADECLYDQATHRAAYRRLQDMHETARFLPEENALEIGLKRGRVVLWTGGCMHLGFAIRYYGRDDADYRNRKALFKKSIELLRSFDPGLADPAILKRALGRNQFRKIEPHRYLVDYPSMTQFTISYTVEMGEQRIEVSYYR